VACTVALRRAGADVRHDGAGHYLNHEGTSMTTKTDQRRRLDWLRVSFADTSGHGHPIAEEDIAALPAEIRDEAREIARNARRLHRAGERAEALQLAREAIAKLDESIDEDWQPPTERPDPTVLDAIRGRI
jgi:hypothetical protein